MPEQPTAAVVGAPMAGSETLAAKIAQLAGGDSTALDGAKALGKIELILPLPHEENIRLVAGARFLVSLTNSDGASLSVMEAMAVGTIPVVSDIAPNREWITHGKNGFLIPLRDADEAGRRFQQAVNLSAEDQSQFVARNKAIIFERGLLTRNTGRVSRRMKELLE